MSRTPARFTQADIARAWRAVKDDGGEVVVAKDGSIIVRPSTVSTQETASVPVEKRPEVVL